MEAPGPQLADRQRRDGDSPRTSPCRARSDCPGRAAQSSSASLRRRADGRRDRPALGGRWCSRGPGDGEGSLPAARSRSAPMAVVAQVAAGPAHRPRSRRPALGRVVPGGHAGHRGDRPAHGPSPLSTLPTSWSSAAASTGRVASGAERRLGAAGHADRVAAVGAAHAPPQGDLARQRGRPPPTPRRPRPGPPGHSEPKNRVTRWTRWRADDHGISAWSMQNRVAGMASSRASPMGLPHTSHSPYVPSSNLARAWSTSSSWSLELVEQRLVLALLGRHLARVGEVLVVGGASSLPT